METTKVAFEASASDSKGTARAGDVQPGRRAAMPRTCVPTNREGSPRTMRETSGPSERLRLCAGPTSALATAVKGDPGPI